MHGARGGAKPVEGHPNYRHGKRSQEAVANRELVKSFHAKGETQPIG
jgi:hypothetical protein